MYKIPANTLFVGKNLVYVPECHSTNDLALQLSHQPATPEGTVVITDSQTAGRGQRGNAWEAMPGQNFTFSLILKPAFLASVDQFHLNIFTSLAVADFVKEKTTLPVQIKWPNDVLVNGKKLCGILIESQLQGSRFSNTIIGIGLNVNQKKFAVDTATSLSLVTGDDFDLTVEHELLLEQLEKRYVQLRQKLSKTLLADYLQQLYWIHEEHLFLANDGEFRGVIKGINDVGKLTIQTVGGGERYFDIKEIAYIN